MAFFGAYTHGSDPRPMVVIVQTGNLIPGGRACPVHASGGLLTEQVTTEYFGLFA